MRELGRIRGLALLAEEPWEPVGWTKCGACPFHERCWTRAEKSHDVAVIYKVDKGTARALRDMGITTYDQLLETMDARTLRQLKRPWGSGEQRVGKAADRILAQARALSNGQVIPIGDLALPKAPSFVIFDLEGVPPQYDEMDKVYLWGTQVFGDSGPRGPYTPAVAGFGPEGDREGWEHFLEVASAIFAQYGDIPFVHWAEYEKTKLKSYLVKFGDTGGVAARVLHNCFDLLTAVRDSLALPVPSYSLKVIEKLSGFRRTMKEYGGDWSIGRYIRAGEKDDEGERARIMEEILRYNEEDLQATWAVFKWAEAHQYIP